MVPQSPWPSEDEKIPLLRGSVAPQKSTGNDMWDFSPNDTWKGHFVIQLLYSVILLDCLTNTEFSICILVWNMNKQ